VCVEEIVDWRIPWNLYRDELITLDIEVEKRDEIIVDGYHERWEDVSSSGIVRQDGTCRVIFVSGVQQNELLPCNIISSCGLIRGGIWQIWFMLASIRGCRSLKL
jgi:hypothetical protein